jgi:AcrR family transcriptional regulator
MNSSVHLKGRKTVTKVRTEARRRAILQAATSLFLEMGYERATMAELTQRLGGSKATLYGYFASKEELFAAVVEEIGEAYLAEALADLKAMPEVGLEPSLQRFAEKMLRLMLQDEAMALHRMIVGASARSDIGEVFVRLGPRKCLETVAAALLAAMERGDLARGSPKILALQLLGLVRAEIELRQYIQTPSSISRKQIAAMAGRAIRMFLGGQRYAAREPEERTS